MIIIKKLTSVLIVFGLILGLGCGKKDEPSPKIERSKIGVIAPYEGSNAHIGEMIMNSVKLYFEQNTVEGLEVELVPVDTKSNPADAVAAVQSTVADNSVVAFIGFYHSSTALACKPIIQESKIPTLIYSASNPKVTENTSYYFRLVPTDDNQAIVLTNFAKELGAQKIAILYYADEYGKGLSDGIQSQAEKIGLTVEDIQSYDPSTTDFRPVLTVLKSKELDVIMICGFVEKSIAILNQAAEKGLKATFLAGDGTFNEEQLIDGTGNNSEGVYVAAPYVFDMTNQKNKSYLEAYWGKYFPEGQKKKPASWSAFAYDSAAILGKALLAGHKDRASIHAFLKKMNSKETGYDGVVGLTYFNEKGDAVGRQFRLAVVKDQEFQSGK